MLVAAAALTALGQGPALAEVPPEEEHCVWTEPTGWHCIVLFPEDPIETTAR